MDTLSGHLLVQELCWGVGGGRLADSIIASPSQSLPFTFGPLRGILTFVLPALSGQVPEQAGPVPVPGMNLYWSMPAMVFSLSLWNVVAMRKWLWDPQLQGVDIIGPSAVLKIHLCFGHDSCFLWAAPKQWQSVAGTLRQADSWETQDSNRWLCLECSPKTLLNFP